MFALTASPPDAVKVPLGYARGESSGERLRFLKDRFAPVLWSAAGGSVAIFNQGAYYFIAKDADQTLYFPFGHERYGQPRFDWLEQGNGISFGRLVEGA